MNRKKWTVAGIVVVVLGIGLYWLIGRVYARAQVADVKELQAKLEEGKLPDDQRRKMRGELREKVEALPESLRTEFREEREKRGMEEGQKRFAAFFALPPEKQIAEIDKLIDQQEKQVQRRDQRRAANANNGNANNRNGGRGGGDQGRERWRNMTDQQRSAFRKRMVDRTTPEMRAQFTEWARMMQQRRKERGLPERGRW